MMEFERRYELAEEDALARLHALTDYWSAKHGLDIRWNGGDVALNGKVKGVRFDGTVRVGEGVIRARVKANFLAEKLGGRAYVSRKLDEYLDPSQSLEELRARVPQ